VTRRRSRRARLRSAENSNDGSATVSAADLKAAAKPLNSPNPSFREVETQAEIGRLVGEIAEERTSQAVRAGKAGKGNRIEPSALLADGTTRFDSFYRPGCNGSTNC